MEGFVNTTYKLAVLAWVKATLMLAATVQLFQNNIIVTADTLIGSLTEADYSGYAAATVTWHVASISDDGTTELVSDQLVFRPSGSAIQNTVYGYWVETSAGSYQAVGNLPAGVFMGATTDELVIVLRWRVGDEIRAEVIS